ncbi:MAG TPA: MBL fold metallo-hydrolase [bacterium]|nr:MBL fold metallo-hydrolase [bacterium]
MRVKFWGVRGSIATPGPATIKYGGNTSCVEVGINDYVLVLDAGTGIRLLGLDLLRRHSNSRIHLLISHPHWDHIQGLPFFLPAFRDGYELSIYGHESKDQELEKTLANQMDPLYFPVQLGDLSAKLNFNKVDEGSFYIEDVRIDTMFLNHPGYNLGYRITYQEKSLVYATDNQPFGQSRVLGMWATEEYFEQIKNRQFPYLHLNHEDPDQRIIDFARDADLLIHDAQYTTSELGAKSDWGHSSYVFATEVAANANVKSLILFHHDPEHSDAIVNKMEKQAQSLLHKTNPEISCQAAYEGLEIKM